MSNKLVFTLIFTLLAPAIHAQVQSTAIIEDSDQAIIVEGERDQQTGLIDAPVKVEVLDDKYLEEQQYQDLSQAIGDIPGVTIQATERRAGSQSVLIQGFGEDSVLVMVDGTPVSQNSSFGFDISQIGASDIKKVEVIKGGASALYGSQAMGGVINIITKKPSKKTKLSLESSLARISEGGENRNLQFLGSGEFYGVGTKVSLSNRETDAFDLDSSTITIDGTENSRLHGSVYLDKKIGKNNFYAQYMLMRGESQSTTSVPFNSSTFGPSVNITENETQNIRVGMERDLGNGLLKVIANYELNEDYLVLSDNPNTANIETFKDTEVEAKRGEVILRDFNYGNQNITAGILVKEDEVNQITTSETIPGTVVVATDIEARKIRSYEGYFQNSFFVGNFEVSPGARYQYDMDFGSNITPKVNVSHYADYKDISFKTWATVGTGFRVPSVKERFFTLDHTSVANYIIEGNPNLQPEESLSFQVGEEIKLFKRHRIYTNLFLNQISNLINTVEAESGTSTTLFTYQNVDSAISRGVEVGVDSQLTDKLTAKVNFSYTEVFNENTDLLIANRPLYLAMASLKTQWTPKLNTILLGRYQGAQFVDEGNLDASPDYSLVDLKVNYQWSDSIKIFSSINNLLNETRDPGRDLVVPTADLRPARGREIFFGMRASL